MEDQYLRRGLRLKSVSTAFQQLAEMPGERRRTNELSRFTLTGTVSRSAPVYREIDIKTGTATALRKSPPVTISFDDLVQVAGEGIVGIDDFLGLEEYPDED